MSEGSVMMNRESLNELKREYEKALRENKEEFEFRGHAFFVGYAKYFIEFVEGQLGL